MAWYSEEEIIKTLSEYVKGDSMTVVADRAGVTRESVRNWAKKAGIPIRKEDAPMKRNWESIRETLERIEEKIK